MPPLAHTEEEDVTEFLTSYLLTLVALMLVSELLRGSQK